MCEQRARMTSGVGTTDYRLGWLCHLGVGLVVVLAVYLVVVNILLSATPVAAGAPGYDGSAYLIFSLGGSNIDFQLRNSEISRIIHSYNISTNAVKGYDVTLASATSSTSLVHQSGYAIPATSATMAAPAALPPDTWGVAPLGMANFSPQSDYESNDQSVLKATKYAAVPAAGQAASIMSGNGPTKGSAHGTVYYAINWTGNPQFRAGIYQTKVVYTATIKVPPPPKLASVTPDSYMVNSPYYGGVVSDAKITLSGTSLATVSSVILDIDGDGKLSSGDIQCGEITVLNDATISCVMSNFEASKAPLGKYDILVVTQGGRTKLAKAFSLKRYGICANRAGAGGDCQVDLDENMIPVDLSHDFMPKLTSLTNAQIRSGQVDWYDYYYKKWANAVTVKLDKLAKYKNKSVKVDWDDVLGYWVYIPRYAYEVQRRNATDRYVGAQNFEIQFEKSTDVKKRPATSCNAHIKTAGQMWANGTPDNVDGNILAKDYRTGCQLDRTYYKRDQAKSSQTTWATHPAFSFGDKELNGIWVGKFETTGVRSSPTVKPSQKSNVSEPIGNFFTMAKSIGVGDPSNTGGSTIAGTVNNSHNLAKATTHLAKSSEWGAIAYLASSIYGVGVGGLGINNYVVGSGGTDADGQIGDVGVTGCGQGALAVNTGAALNATTIESDSACGRYDQQYDSSQGVKASTTNFRWGVYDLSGGAHEITAGNRTNFNDSTTALSGSMTTPAKEPYVNLYRASQGFGTRPGWSISSNEAKFNFDNCTFETCGGQALHETKSVMSVDGDSSSWNGGVSNFTTATAPWSVYGGSARFGNRAGLFASEKGDGEASIDSITMRATLIVP